MRHALTIQSWRPTNHPAPRDARSSGDGFTSWFYESHALVKVFSYGGGEHGKPFTVIEAYYHDQLHQARLPRAYHPRWHGRLANQFDWQISKIGGGA